MFGFTSFCMLGSLILGFAAWLLPVVGYVWAHRGRHWRRCSVASFVLCAASLQLQLEASANWARGEDVAALLDCCHAQAVAGRLMLAVALILNFLLVLVLEPPAQRRR
ncbi:MAG: hypothetical protein IJ347_09230 [Faecalibacterium sp.]|nr:hypothetical protein [Faecalibacterium sp.]